MKEHDNEHSRSKDGDGPQLTASEKRYLNELRRVPSLYRSRLLGWLLELTPGIGLFAYGLASNSRLFTTLGFLSQLYFSVWRIFAQYRGARLLLGMTSKGVWSEGVQAGRPTPSDTLAPTTTRTH